MNNVPFKSLRKHIMCLLINGLLVGIPFSPMFGQAADKIIFGGVSAIYGVGRYNPINYGVGISGRVQYPLTPTVALTAKVGLERYQLTYSNLILNSYLGYGYNAITGFGFNTLYYNYYGYDYKVTSMNIPFSFGPRLYLTDRLHTDLNVGVDIAVNERMTSVLHVEPGVGYVLPLNNGGLLDVNLGYFTNFAQGSGAFTIGVAYGLKINR